MLRMIIFKELTICLMEMVTLHGRMWLSSKISYLFLQILGGISIKLKFPFDLSFNPSHTKKSKENPTRNSNGSDSVCKC